MLNNRKISPLSPQKPIPSYDNQWLGIGWKILASVCFACGSGLIRLLSKGTVDLVPLPIHQIIFLENLVGLVLIIPLILKIGVKTLKDQASQSHALRVAFACGGIIFWYQSLKHMQIGYASALAFTGPIFTVLGGFFILKERLTRLKNIAILSSIVGAFFIIRPDLALFGTGSLLQEIGGWICFPIFSALCLAGAKLSARKLASTGESPAIMTIYLMLALAPTTLLPGLISWVDVSLNHIILTTLLGLIATLAHYATSRSYVYAGVNFLTPFSFLRLLMGIVVGYVLFQEIPQSASVWIGMIIILCGVLFLSLDRAPSHESKAI